MLLARSRPAAVGSRAAAGVEATPGSPHAPNPAAAAARGVSAPRVSLSSGCSRGARAANLPSPALSCPAWAPLGQRDPLPPPDCGQICARPPEVSQCAQSLSRAASRRSPQPAEVGSAPSSAPSAATPYTRTPAALRLAGCQSLSPTVSRSLPIALSLSVPVLSQERPSELPSRCAQFSYCTR